MNSDESQGTRGLVPSITKHGSLFAICALVLSSCDLVQPFKGLMREPYALDDVSRTVTADQSLECDRESLVRYEGELVAFEPALSVAPAFVERLQRLERAVVELGRASYGRPPSQILNAGAFACRRVAHRPDRLSEHALGNAVDVTGFRFPPLDGSEGDEHALSSTTPRSSTTPTSTRERSLGAVPKELKAQFLVTVRDDWQVEAEEQSPTGPHEHFFRRLAQVIRREDMFRSAIGPPDANHETHLHLDMAPWGTMRL